VSNMHDTMNNHGIAAVTERLTIRAWTTADLDAWFAIYGDAEVCKGLSRPPLGTSEEAKEDLEKLISRHSAMEPGMGAWAIEASGARQVVGTLLLKHLPDSEKVEIGWHLARAYWGRGYATEAARWAQARAFKELELGTLYAVAYPWNTRSIKVMERLGMSKLGLTSEYYGKELVMYAQTREQYQATMGAS